MKIGWIQLGAGLIIGVIICIGLLLFSGILVTPADETTTTTSVSTTTRPPITSIRNMTATIPPTNTTITTASTKNVTQSSAEQLPADILSNETPQWSPFGTDLSGCSNGDNGLSSPPLYLETSYMIEPMGKIAGAHHITPTDHLYIYVDIVDDKLEDVLAPAAGYIVKIQRMSDREGTEDYRIIIEHSCTLFTYYIHLQELDPIIVNEIGKIVNFQSYHKRIAVSSGQVIGKVGKLLSYQRTFNQSGLDFALIDTTITLPGFVIPGHYDNEAWKIHTVDPFDYYEEPLRSQLLEKNFRDINPRGGKIDFDIDGRLVGNWFLDGTENYGARGVAGKSKAEWMDIYGRDVGECTSEYWDRDKGESIGIVPCDYWLGHLTFAYDNIIPDQIKISMGVFWDFEGGPPWGVKNNAPDPSSVDIETGIVKYEIFTDFENNIESEPFNIVGVLLVQMIDDQTIKVELFLGKSFEEINNFSEEARFYRR